MSYPRLYKERVTTNKVQVHIQAKSSMYTSLVFLHNLWPCDCPMESLYSVDVITIIISQK